MEQKNETFTDPRDGKTYFITKTGDKIWMAEKFNFEREGALAFVEVTPKAGEAFFTDPRDDDFVSLGGG